MNHHAILKGFLTVAILSGAGWLWWQYTAPDMPIAPCVPVQSSVKSTPVPAIVPKFLQKQVAISAPKATTTVSSIMPSMDSYDTTANALKSQSNLPEEIQPGIKALVDAGYYARAHQFDPSLPDSTHLTVPLDQAEHHVFHSLLGGGHILNASIEAYYSDPQGGPETVELYIWNDAELPNEDYEYESRRNLDDFSPADQDYIRNWAKQQAAAAAEAVAPPTSSAPESPAPTQTAQAPQGPLVITN